MSAGPAHLEALFKVIVLFQEQSIVNDDLRGGDAQVQNAVIHSFRRLGAAREIIVSCKLGH